MVIDFHAHTFPDKIAPAALQRLSGASHSKPFTDGTNEGLGRSMRAAGIDKSIILPVATAPRQVESINTASAKLNETYQEEGLISLGCMHPDYENAYEELGRIKSLGLAGIKIHPVYQNAALDDVRYLRIFDRAAQLGLLVVTHAGFDIGYPGVDLCSPLMALHVWKEIGSFPLVLAHMGGWRQWDEVCQYLPETGFYLDTAFSTGKIHPLEDGSWPEESPLDMLDADGFLKICHAFGPDRLLFGTDSPWSPQEEALAFLRSLPLSKEDQDRILGENAARLFRERGLLDNSSLL